MSNSNRDIIFHVIRKIAVNDILIELFFDRLSYSTLQPSLRSTLWPLLDVVFTCLRPITQQENENESNAMASCYISLMQNSRRDMMGGKKND